MLILVFLACSTSEPAPAASASEVTATEPAPAEEVSSAAPASVPHVSTTVTSTYSVCVLLSAGSTPPAPFTVSYAPAYSDIDPDTLTLKRVPENVDLWCTDTGNNPASPRGMAIVVYGSVIDMVTEVRVYTIDGDFAEATIIEGSDADRAFYELQVPGVPALATVE